MLSGIGANLAVRHGIWRRSAIHPQPTSDLRYLLLDLLPPAMRDQRIRFAQLTEFSYDLASLVVTHRHRLDVQTSRRCRLCRPFGFVLTLPQVRKRRRVDRSVEGVVVIRFAPARYYGEDRCRSVFRRPRSISFPEVPIRIMSEMEAAELRGRLEPYERRTGR